MAPDRRSFIKFSALAGGSIGLGLFPCGKILGAATAPAALLNPIQVENARPGTTAWQLTDPAKSGEIEGYASATSVNRTGRISFFVSTADSSYTIEIFRMGWYGGLGGRRMTGAFRRTGVKQPAPSADATTGLIECHWTDPFVFDIPSDPQDPADWASGVYVAKLTTGSTNRQRYIIFVVRDDNRGADYLFQSSATTYQAYNNWGGKSLYEPPNQAAYKVSFNRPHIEGYGAGHFFSTSSARVPEARGWEYNMVRWLEREGFDVSYCTNLDTHANSNLLLSPKAFLSVGHDEYWSWDMRANVEAARDQGTSLAFFSANTCYWQVRLEPDSAGVPNRTMVCYKKKFPGNDPLAIDSDPSNDRSITTRWRDEPVNLPEASLLGVQFSNYGNDAPLVVDNASHWVFAGTGLQNGDKLPGLVGFETDRLFDPHPAGIIRLAHSPFAEAVYGPDYSDMTVYTAPSGAIVFAAGTILWSYGLDDYNTPPLPGTSISRLSRAAQQMTRNVLARFGERQAPKPRYSIGGRITDSANNGLRGVVVRLSGTAGLATQTDVNGNYWFPGISTGDYTVTPNRLDLRFSPASLAFSNLDSGQAGNFVGTAASSSPVLLTDSSTARAIAMDAVTSMREPFPLSTSLAWGADRRTRILIFAANLGLQAGAKPSEISCEGFASNQTYPMKVESLLDVPGFEWVTALTVRLSDALPPDLGDLLVRVIYRGVASNRVLVGIRHTGGGSTTP